MVNTGGSVRKRVRVWDLPTRIWHWSILILFATCWWTADTDHMRWHLFAGYGVLGVVSFRILWGFCGGQTARFSSFVRGPASVWRYARKLRDRDHYESLGHNPLGALSIIVMLSLLLLQTILGLFAVNNDGGSSGPLSQWVSYTTGRRFAHWHADNFNLLLFLIGLHLTAIVFYRLVRGENLVSAMIHGYKSHRSSGETPYFVPLWRAVLLAVPILIGIVLLARI